MRSFSVAGVCGRAITQHPAFVLLAVVGAFFTWCSRHITLFGFEQSDGMLLDFGLATLSLTGLLTVLLFGTQGLGQEGLGTEELLLAKPIRASEYLLGRYLGVVVGVAASQVLIASVLFSLLTLSGTGVSPSLVAGTILIFLEVCLLAACAVTLSLSVPIFVNVSVVLAIYTLGHMAGFIYHSVVPDAGIGSAFGRVLCAVVPNFENMNAGPAVVRGLDVPFRLVALDAAYCLVYTLLVLVVAGFFLGHREPK